MAAPELTVSLNVDERAILPPKSSVEELLESRESCRYELLPARDMRASEISGNTVGAVAGPAQPPWWEPDPRVELRSVNLFRILGAYYFPAFGVVLDRHGRALRAPMEQAAYLTPDLLLLPHVRSTGRDSVFAPPDGLPTLPRASIAMPWGGVTNYGHFLIDCMSGVASLRRIESLRGHDLVFPPLKAWHRDHLQLLGASPVELPHGCCYVEDAIFTDCMVRYLHAPNWNLRLVPEVQRAALACAGGGGRKIYLSRRGNPKRRFLSEERLESILRDRGFEIVQPETMPVPDQIALFANAAVVAGCAGAAFANTIYCNPGAIVLEIQPRAAQQRWVRNICLMMGLKWAPYFCDSLAPDKPVVHGGQVRPAVGITFDFDLGDFLDYLDEVTASRMPAAADPPPDGGSAAPRRTQRRAPGALERAERGASAPAPAFTILLPVHRSPELLPYAIQSVQAQTRQDFELFVICDGAPPETAQCARAFAAKDARIRVFEHPKGEHNGDVYRDQALAEARGQYVCHVGDDDLWLPDFLAEMAILLRDVDFGNLSHLEILADGAFNMLPGDLAVDFVRRRISGGPSNFFGLTFGGYRLSAYRALPVGWFPPPVGVVSDLHMWRKFLAREDLRFGTRIAACALKFAAARRRDWTLARRREEIADWANRMSRPGFPETVRQMALLQLSQSAYNLRLHAENLDKAAKAAGEAVETMKAELGRARADLSAARRQLGKLQRKLAAFRKTASWRLTRPFRRLARLIAR